MDSGRLRLLERRKHLIFGIIAGATAAFALLNYAFFGLTVDPTVYFYIFFGAVVVLYVIVPLGLSRLTGHYLGRTRRNRLAVFGGGYILFLIALALVGPFFTLSPTAADFQDKNMPPLGFSTEHSTYDIKTNSQNTVVVEGSLKHPLGTDNNGRDMLAMLVSGARISLQVGLIATSLAIFCGVFIGVSSAYFGGWVDNALMRFTDVMMTFPFFLLLVLIIFMFGSHLYLIVLVIGLTGWTGVARMVRSDTLSLRTREFVLAARSLGVSHRRIIFRHLIPNSVSTIIVIATLSIPGVILAEASLSFIGLGDPSVTSWGIILNAGQRVLDEAWWVAVEPGILLFFTVLSFNFLGDGLRDAFDPRANVG